MIEAVKRISVLNATTGKLEGALEGLSTRLSDDQIKFLQSIIAALQDVVASETAELFKKMEQDAVKEKLQEWAEYE